MTGDRNTIFYSDYYRIDAEGKNPKILMEPGRQVEELWEKFFGNGSTSLIHKSVFDKCGLFDESLRHSEDYEFWLRATMIYNIKMELYAQPTIKYRIHPDQLTNSVRGSLDKQIKDSIRKRLAEIQH